MQDWFDEFIDKTADEVKIMYDNDEFRDGFSEAIDTFKNAVYDFMQENIDPEQTCRIIEYNGDYDDAIEVATTFCEELKGFALEDYYTAEFYEVHFFILILKKDEK